MTLLLCTHVAPDDPGGVAASGRRWAAGLRALGGDLIWCQCLGDETYRVGHDERITVPVTMDMLRRTIEVTRVRGLLLHYAGAASATALALTRDHRLPLIVNLRGNDVTLGVFEPAPLLEAVLDAAAHVIFVASHLRLLVEARWGALDGRATVVQNWPIVASPTSGSQVGARPMTFGLMGLWKWKKGLEVMLDALTRDPALIAHTRIWGDLSRTPAHVLRKYDGIRAAGLPEIVPFPPADAVPILSGIRVLVIPSLVEGMPNVVFEGMAAGCAILGSDIPGIREIVRDTGAGLLFEPGDAGDLARRSRELLNDPDRVAAIGAQNAQTILTSTANPWSLLPSSLLESLDICAA